MRENRQVETLLKQEYVEKTRGALEGYQCMKPVAGLTKKNRHKRADRPVGKD